MFGKEGQMFVFNACFFCVEESLGVWIESHCLYPFCSVFLKVVPHECGTSGVMLLSLLLLLLLRFLVVVELFAVSF